MYSQPVEHTTNMIYAFCIGDWKFFTVARVEIIHYLSCDPSSIRTVSINYRFQKDPKKHNITVTYAATPEAPMWCPALRMLSILKRHHRLNMRSDQPLAVYKRNPLSNKGSFILKVEVKKRMTRAAKAVYPSTPFTKNYSCHSCRIGATALLFARYRDPELVRKQLRWDSEIWREYIRFTPINAGLHGNAVATVDTDNVDITFD